MRPRRHSPSSSPYAAPEPVDTLHAVDARNYETLSRYTFLSSRMPPMKPRWMDRLFQATALALALCSCSAGSTAVQKDDSCRFDANFSIDARRYSRVDADDPRFHQWSPWTIKAALVTSANEVRGRITMQGDNITWDFPVVGKFDRARCELHAEVGDHHPFALTAHFGAAIEGTIQSIDDIWKFGPAK